MIDWPKPITCLITPGNLTSENFYEQKSELLEIVTAAAEDGVSMIQIREKRLDARSLFELVRQAARAISKFDVRLLVNDRFDIALAAEAHGIHLTSNSIPTAVVRSIVRDELMIGISAHSGSELRKAVEDGANFATYGPIFYSPGKGDATGTESLAAACSDVHPFPVIALGGVDETNIHEVLSSGAAGFAAIRALNNQDTRSRIMSEVDRLKE